MTIRVRWMRWTAVAALATAACDGSGRDGSVPRADTRLDGAWTAEFRLTSPLQLANGAPQGSLSAEVVLMENPAVRAVPGLHGTPTHYGAYAADFRPFALPTAATGRVPTVAARLAGGDSVEMVLDGIGSGLLLTGRLDADSVAGRWTYPGDRAGGANGTFVLRRRKD
ncbi:MAG TPA: hypothetical protein VEQ60_20730, partial [Longimicrobium sp.]|nr:hypothetical protein [Longimicrobium sp.]